MPVVFPPSGFGRTYQYTAKSGVTVTSAGTAHTMGAYATLIDPLSYECFALGITVRGVSVSAGDSRGLMDIVVAPTGGGSEQIVIPYMNVGGASSDTDGQGVSYFWPLYVPKGKAIRARWQSVTINDPATVIAHAYELPPHGFAEDAPQEWVQYGADVANSRGTALTAGNGIFGTAIQIGTTSRAHRWFHTGIDFGTDTSIAAGFMRVRLSKDSAGNEILGVWDYRVSAGEAVNGPYPSFPVCVPVPSGTALWVSVNAAANESMSVMAYAY